MNRDEAIQKLALRCRYDLFFLAKHILGYDLMEEAVHGDMCKYTESLLPSRPPEWEPPSETHGEGLEDQYKNGNTNLLLLMPRGTFKSSVVTIGFSLQYILNDPNARILIDSETFTKAKAFLSEIKDHLESNEAYREVFKAIHGMYPDDGKKKEMLWTDSQIKLACRSKPQKEPTFMVSGIDKTINGMHYDMIIMDDVHSEKNVTNKEQIQQVIDHWKLSYSLLDPGKPLIVIGTRWHYLDLYNHILKYERERFNIMVRRAVLADGSLLFPERLSQQVLDDIKATQGTYIFSCTPAGTPILMSDWTFKNVENIQVGDEVVGYQRVNGGRTKMVPTKVLSIGSRQSMVQAVHTDNMVIRCTPDHQWYTKRLDKTHRLYREAEVGMDLMEFTNVFPEDEDNYPVKELAYLAGIIDGGGSVKRGSIAITQSEIHNPGVCQRIEEALNAVGFPYKKHETKPGQFQWVINGGRDSKIRLLNFTNLGKKQQLVDNLWSRMGRPVQKKHRIYDIQELGIDTVYSFQTGTGNYVAYGLMSRNCQYLNEPADNENAVFKASYIVRTDWELVKDRPINWYLAVDPSYEGPYSDYAALVVAGMDFQRDLYVRHILRMKMTYSDIIRNMFDLYNRYQPKLVILETIGTQKSIMYELANEQKRRGTWIPLREISGSNRPKEERIRGLAPFYENGHAVHIIGANQIDDLEYELLQFPVGEHDDIIDALARVLEFASPPNAPNSLLDEDDKPIRRVDYKPRSIITGV